MSAHARRRPIALSMVGLALPVVAMAIPLPADGRRFEVSGYLDTLFVAEMHDTPSQYPQGIGVVRLDTQLASKLHGHVELRGLIGGPYVDGEEWPNRVFYNLGHEFQVHSPALEFPEAYLDLEAGALDVRLGMQRFAWGSLDGVPPTDVLNPRDFHDPIVTDFEEAKIGIPAARITYRVPDVPRLGLDQLRGTLVYVPFAVPPRLARIGERWFPTALTPGSVHIDDDEIELALERTIARKCRRPNHGGIPATRCPPLFDVDLDVTSPVDLTPTLRTANRHPPRTFDAGAIGVRIDGTLRDAEWSLYYYTGEATTPNLHLDVAVSDRALNAGSREVDLDGLRARVTLEQATSRIHMTGVDVSTSIGGATARLEAAWTKDRPLLRFGRDLVSESRGNLRLQGPFVGQALTRGCSSRMPCRGTVDVGDIVSRQDVLEWGLGADYIVRGTFVLGQVVQTIVLDPAPRLLIADPETRLTAVVRRRFLHDRLECEMRAVYTVERGAWYVFPRVAYDVTDDFRVRVGYLAIGGTERSPIGQFRRNDEWVVQARWSF